MLNRESVELLYKSEGIDNIHGFDHIERVHRNAMYICEGLSVNKEIVDAASWLHDIARGRESRGECSCHALEGAKISKKILKDFGFSEEHISRVAECISQHRFSKGIVPETLESRILQDADRLDAIGAIAIARVFSYGGAKQRPLYISEKYETRSETSIDHFYKKILKIKPSSFHTRIAKNLAIPKYKVTVDYVCQFLNEWRGEDLI